MQLAFGVCRFNRSNKHSKTEIAILAIIGLGKSGPIPSFEPCSYHYLVLEYLFVMLTYLIISIIYCKYMYFIRFADNSNIAYAFDTHFDTHTVLVLLN